MKKIFLVLFLCSSVLSAETVYVMTSKDYYDLCSKIAVLQTQFDMNTNNVVLYRIRSYQEVMDKFKMETREKITSELTLDEKLSIIRGDINLLEMKLLKLEAEVKRK